MRAGLDELTGAIEAVIRQCARIERRFAALDAGIAKVVAAIKNRTTSILAGIRKPRP